MPRISAAPKASLPSASASAPARCSRRVCSTLIPIGASIIIVAVFDSHIDSSAVTSMKPPTRRRCPSPP